MIIGASIVATQTQTHTYTCKQQERDLTQQLRIMQFTKLNTKEIAVPQHGLQILLELPILLQEPSSL